jgi:PhnB protein
MTVDLQSEFPGPTPQLIVDNADRAISFYRTAFGADELVRNAAPDGRVMHCELLVFGGRLIVCDDFDEDPARSPHSLGGTTVRLHLYVSNVDDVYAKAMAAGASSVAEPEDAFWGERYAIIKDPCGHQWSLATPNENISVSELESRADAWSSSQRGRA